LIFWFLLNQLNSLIKPVLLTLATADQDPDMLVEQCTGKKAKNGSECAFPQGHPDPEWIPAEIPLPN